MSVEHVFELPKSFKSIEYRHVDVKEYESNRVKGLVSAAVVDMDAAQQTLNIFNYILAIVCGCQLICDFQIVEASLKHLNVYKLVVGVNDLSRLAIFT